MNLWILRHGEAEPHARSDAERALTAHGRQEVLQSSTLLVGQPLQRIIASPYLRAQQSAALVRESLGFTGAIITVPWLTPDSDPQQVLEELKGYHNESVLLVSHQPLVGRLLGEWVNAAQQEPLPMRTASLAWLVGQSSGPGMQLQSLDHPD